MSCVANMSHPRARQFCRMASLTNVGFSRHFSRKNAFSRFRSVGPTLNACPPPRQLVKYFPALRLVSGRGPLIGYENDLKAAPETSLLRARWLSIIESSNTIGLVSHE